MVAQVEAVARVSVGTIVDNVVGASEAMSAADVADVKPVYAVPVAEVQEAPFVELLVQGFRFLVCRLLLTGSRCGYQQEN